MERDIIEELGSLALATRLKNLSERLAKDVSQIYKKSELDFEPRWFTLVYALKEGQELAVTELSAMLKQTHPAINQVANVLVANELVNERKDDADQRKRLLKLSTKGEMLVSKMSDLWDQIKKANDQLLDESGGMLLDNLDKVEQALNNKSMYERIRSFQA